MTSHDPKAQAAGFSDEEYGMPCAEALLAGTLALMTGHAQACCAGQRGVMAHKVVANLDLLVRHPGLSPAFRAMLGQLQRRWVQQEGGGEPMGLPPQALWHTAPQAVQ